MNERVPKRYLVALFGLQFLAFAIAAFVAVRYWLAPWMPVAAFATFGVAPMLFWAFVGAFVFDPTAAKDGIVADDAPPVRTRMKLSIVPILGFGIVFSAALAMWFSPATRAAALEFGAGQRMMSTLESGLRDSHPDVRLTACEGMRRIGSDVTTGSLVERLHDDSPEVVDCALESLPATAPETTPFAVKSAAAGWFKELMAAENEVEPERACRLADRLRVAERVGVGYAPVLLMECALAGPSGPARECCGQSFRATLGADAEPPMVLPTPEKLARTDFVQYVPVLVQTAFGTSAEQEQRRQSLRLDGARSTAWTLAVACEALGAAGADWRAPVSSVVAKVISSESCRVEPATERTVRIWTAACSEVVGPDDVGVADGHEAGQLCALIDAGIVIDSVNEARHATQVALRRAREPHYRTRLMKALLDYSNNRAQEDRSKPATTKPFALGTRESPVGEKDMGLVQMLIKNSGAAPSDPEEEDAVYELMEEFVRSGKVNDVTDEERARYLKRRRQVLEQRRRENSSSSSD